MFLPNSGMLSYKYLNAKIKDAGGRVKIVHVINQLGDYFVTTINHKPYVFKIESADIGIIDEWGVKKYRIIDFSTKHYKPISDKTDAIKHLLDENNLPRINMPLFNVLKNLGKREKHDFEKHDIEVLLNELVEAKNSKLAKILGRDSKYQEAAAGVIEFLQSLNTKEIVTPTREIAAYIEDDLITTDPGFYGTVITTQQRTDIEHKRITNTPVGPKRPYIILIAIMLGIAVAIMGVYLLYDAGTFDGITSMIPDLSGVSFAPPSIPAAPGSVMERYPTPESAKAAIDRGEAKLTDFPANMQPLISSVKVTVTP